MNKLIELLKGKKTHIIAAVICTLGILQGFDIFVVPEYAYVVLTGMGLTTLRLGVNKVADAVKPPAPKKTVKKKKP